MYCASRDSIDLNLNCIPSLYKNAKYYEYKMINYPEKACTVELGYNVLELVRRLSYVIIF